ncbi:MAG: hypothetical protein J6V38_03285 [Kiritimatiellae bacterium]|jgi:hypothetical protein|nr:hypothetical protein [Kiritimatiellia bacterium]
MKIPEGKTITLTFLSTNRKEKEKRWAVNVVLSGGASSGDVFKVKAEDAGGNKIPEAVFEFAGTLIDIKDGIGGISYDDFIKGKHEKGVWLKRPGVEPVPGLLTFA